MIKAQRPRDTLVRAPRVALSKRLLADTKTIGTNLRWHFTTDNVSMSGLLLSTESPTKVPFVVNTILEMTIDPLGEWLDAPVACLGKVVRREVSQITTTQTGPRLTKLGVQIVQIENEAQVAWEKCVAAIEHTDQPIEHPVAG